MNKTLKNVLLVAGIITIPGAGILWLAKKLAEQAASDPDSKDFKKYVKHNFERLKVESEKWIQ